MYIGIGTVLILQHSALDIPHSLSSRTSFGGLRLGIGSRLKGREARFQ